MHSSYALDPSRKLHVTVKDQQEKNKYVKEEDGICCDLSEEIHLVFEVNR